MQSWYHMAHLYQISKLDHSILMIDTREAVTKARTELVEHEYLAVYRLQQTKRTAWKRFERVEKPIVRNQVVCQLLE